MSIQISIHRPYQAEVSETKGGTCWVEIHSDNSEVTIFVNKLETAKAIADAINEDRT